MKYFFVLIGIVIFLWHYDSKNPISGVEVKNESQILGRYEIMEKIKEEYGDIIVEASRVYKIDPRLVLAVIYQESGGNPNAVGPKGEIGLMQLMPGTARDMIVDDPFNPRQNIFGGTRYLRYLLDAFDGDLDKAITAYNIGPNGRNLYKGYAYLKGVKNNYRNIQSGLVF